MDELRVAQLDAAPSKFLDVSYGGQEDGLFLLKGSEVPLGLGMVTLQDNIIA